MSDIWYRGEAGGVRATTPGSTAPHDLGDGMYLTDKEASAKAYAANRSEGVVSKQRVYSVSIDRSSMKVLDLTRDARWKTFIQPVEAILKLGTVNEVYGRSFINFLKAYGIDINQFDAVIGPDYVRGGTQMNILHKGGRPSQLHVNLRRMFKPLIDGAVRVRQWKPKLNLRGRGVRSLSGIRGSVTFGFTVNVAVAVVFRLLRTWLDKRMIEEKVREGLEEVRKQVDEKVKNGTEEVARFQLKLAKGRRSTPMWSRRCTSSRQALASVWAT